MMMRTHPDFQAKYAENAWHSLLKLLNTIVSKYKKNGRQLRQIERILHRFQLNS
jgi:hypothetical protein